MLALTDLGRLNLYSPHPFKSLPTGFGASSVVHQGVFKPLDKACAIKVIDLEAYGRDTEELRRETQLMSLSKHPNILRVRGCWFKEPSSTLPLV